MDNKVVFQYLCRDRSSFAQCYLELNVLHQFKVLCIRPKVFQDFGMMHVVWIIGGNGEVAVGHHLLGDIDGEGTVDTGSVWL